MKDRMLILVLGVSLGIVLKFTIGPSSLFRNDRDVKPNSTQAPQLDEDGKNDIESNGQLR